jgi:hypothetical protein
MSSKISYTIGGKTSEQQFCMEVVISLRKAKPTLSGSIGAAHRLLSFQFSADWSSYAKIVRACNDHKAI